MSDEIKQIRRGTLPPGSGATFDDEFPTIKDSAAPFLVAKEHQNLPFNTLMEEGLLMPNIEQSRNSLSDIMVPYYPPKDKPTPVAKPRTTVRAKATAVLDEEVDI